jgi:hypothetical protein
LENPLIHAVLSHTDVQLLTSQTKGLRRFRFVDERSEEPDRSIARFTQTALGVYYRRLAFRVGKAEAITATALKLAILI